MIEMVPKAWNTFKSFVPKFPWYEFTKLMLRILSN